MIMHFFVLFFLEKLIVVGETSFCLIVKLVPAMINDSFDFRASFSSESPNLVPEMD